MPRTDAVAHVSGRTPSGQSASRHLRLLVMMTMPLSLVTSCSKADAPTAPSGLPEHAPVDGVAGDLRHRLPASTSQQPFDHSAEVELTLPSIKVRGAEPLPLADWMATHPGSVLIEPLRPALAALRPGGDSLRDLRLAIDREVPFGLVVPLLFTAHAAGYESVVFAVDPGNGTIAALPAVLPRLDAASAGGGGTLTLLDGSARKRRGPLFLIVAIHKHGLTLRGADVLPGAPAEHPRGPNEITLAALATPGCAEAPRPVAACMDLLALSRSLREIKSTYPDESSAILAAESSILFGDLVAIMDVVRGDTAKPLFPTLVFSVTIE